ncbi:class I SAM-dependent methyltransferase [Clostridium sp. SHJSY1]|uniref:class I SAM-dependent methyltransferase n=1 Tax=Clostridium sp. SHJSY1 TaxID=2942483 RepID=UPI00287628FA|nr:methyltransferase domain-containing protein [Clostridium sp. SHJSY1]MDS0527642.1 class I SAM-dependent methyltransferase [Clostridium sp. SHJSY1]
MNNQIGINEENWDYKEYFNNLEGNRVAIICEYDGKKTNPLALMGADITKFELSEEKKRHALKLAKYANISIEYIVQYIFGINLNKYKEYFDILYLEVRVLHYFNDINKFMEILYPLLKNGGRIALEDFRPIEQADSEKYLIKESYIDKELYKGDVENKNYCDKNGQERITFDYLKIYTLSEIINSILQVGFKLKQFDEHPEWTNDNNSGQFTILAIK